MSLKLLYIAQLICIKYNYFNNIQWLICRSIALRCICARRRR